MDLIDSQSVYRTAVNVDRALARRVRLSGAERIALARHIVEQSNPSHGYHFYPTSHEFSAGIRLLTGEKPRTELGRANAVELEVLRALALLQPEAPELKTRLHTIYSEADTRLRSVCYREICPKGECALASIAVLRYQMAAGHSRHNQYLDVTVMAERGLNLLAERHSDDGKWRGFPFHFTLLWLTELAVAGGTLGRRAISELVHARQACRHDLMCRSPARGDVSETRRQVVIRAMALLPAPLLRPTPAAQPACAGSAQACLVYAA